MIDAAGDIVIPGFVDTHRHTWETSIRTCAPDYTLGRVLRGHPRPVRPQVPAAGRARREPLGRPRVPQRGHHDAGRLVAHHEHAGPRGRGHRRAGGDRPAVGVRVRLPEHVDPDLVVRAGLDGLGRADRRRPGARGPGAPVRRRGPDHDGPRHPGHELLQARGRALRVGARQGARDQHHGPRRHGPLRPHERPADGAPGLDLLYPDTTYVHGSHLTDEEWLLVRDSGGNVSLAPQIELQMGHGWAPAQKADKLGIPVGLSSDVATTASSDAFTQMHAILSSERGLRHQASWDEDLDGNTGTPDLITARDALRWATIDGAKVAGVAGYTGSITPGKKADLVIIDGSASTWPRSSTRSRPSCAPRTSRTSGRARGRRLAQAGLRLVQDLGARAPGRPAVARLARPAGARRGRPGSRPPMAS